MRNRFKFHNKKLKLVSTSSNFIQRFQVKESYLFYVEIKTFKKGLDQGGNSPGGVEIHICRFWNNGEAESGEKDNS